MNEHPQITRAINTIDNALNYFKNGVKNNCDINFELIETKLKETGITKEEYIKYLEKEKIKMMNLD